MRNIVLAVVSVLVLSSEAPEAGTEHLGEPLPLHKLLDETKGAPHECTDFHEISQTCLIIRQFSQTKDGLVSHDEMSFQLPNGQLVTVRVRTKLMSVGKQTCTNNEGLDVSVLADIEPAISTELEERIRSQIWETGLKCVSYFRRPDGGYIAVWFDVFGRQLIPFPFKIDFFSVAPALRSGRL